MKRNSTFGKINLRVIIVLAIVFVGLISSCKEREDNAGEGEMAHVLFQVQTSPDVSVNAIVTQIGTIQGTKYNVDLSTQGYNWFSEPQMIDTSVGAVQVSMTGKGTDASSMAILRVFINGEQKALDTVRGVNLMGKARVSFL